MLRDVLSMHHYFVHFLTSFVNAFNKIRVEIEYIPKGCTSVSQPVNIGFNSLRKSHVKTKYMRWQIVENRQHYGNNPYQPILKSPSLLTRKIVECVLSAYEEILEATIRKQILLIGFVTPVIQNLPVDN
jgi:hypothetical protein